MTRANRLSIVAGIAAACVPAILLGQANLSTQGFGYPPGQMSTRALSLGGGTGELDQTTPLNPASTALLQTRTVLFQIQPEFRTLTYNGVSAKTTTARYPLIYAGVPFGDQWVTSVSASTLLDRSWSTSTTKFSQVGADSTLTTFNEASNGAINDVQIAEAWSNRRWLYLGVALHGITGRNTVTTGRDFFDSTEFSPFSASRVLSYTGTAVSAGFQLVAGTQGAVGVSYRKGGKMRVRTNDSLLAQGNVPDHFGISVGYAGIPGSLLTVRAAHDGWSSMNSMIESPTVHGHDTWDLGGGAEVPGPHVGGQTLLFRGGYRTRMLPYEAAGSEVTEHTFSLGSAFGLAEGRVVFDVTGMRQLRNVSISGLRERAWTLSISLTARP
jgi:hypothetical protein